MKLDNNTKEMLWVDAWNDLDDLLSKQEGLLIVDRNWQAIDLETAKGEIQDQAYQSKKTIFEPTFYNGRPAIRLCFEDGCHSRS